MHFRSIKNAVARPLHRFGYMVAGLPGGLQRAIMRSIGTAARAAYFFPDSHLFRAVDNFCHVTGRPDSWRIFSSMVANIEHTALHFGRLYRYGRDQLVAQTDLDLFFQAESRRLSQAGNGLIILVPHCIGAVLSSARLSMFHPTVLLVREPRDQNRCRLLLEYLEKLGPEFILARNTPPTVVMRRLVRALKDRKVVVGTTDALGPDGPDKVDARAFGQRIYSPSWPAELSSRLNAPILPAYIHMEGPKIKLLGDKGYVATDVRQCTQRWVSSFERRIRQYPSDWAFMLDKNWARVLAEAAMAQTRQLADREHSYSFDSDHHSPQRS